MGPSLVLPAARFDLAALGELLGDPSRVTMLLALMDGTRRPASELARLAGVAPSTATFNLQRLESGGLVRAEASGRHRYFELADAQVASALEMLAALRPAPAKKVATPERRALAHARTCYHHLAGELGVALLGALEARRFVRLRDGEIALTARGREWARSFPSDAPWPPGKACLDWTARRPHLGGSLGTCLADALFRARWIAKKPNGRAVRITALGVRELERQLGVRLTE